MGWVIMSERELNRVEVLSRVVDGRRTVAEAASILGMSKRQVKYSGFWFGFEEMVPVRFAIGAVDNDQTIKRVLAFATMPCR